MPTVTKFNSKCIHRIVELAELGNNNTRIAMMIDVSRQALHRYLSKNPKVKQLVIDGRSSKIRDEVKHNLRVIASGAETRETIREYIEEDEETGRTIKVTERIRIEKPDLKANQVLARQVDKDLSDNVEQHDQRTTASIYISEFNTGTMSLRELQDNTKASPLGSIVVEAESREVIESIGANNESIQSDSEGD